MIQTLVMSALGRTTFFRRQYLRYWLVLIVFGLVLYGFMVHQNSVSDRYFTSDLD